MADQCGIAMVPNSFGIINMASGSLVDVIEFLSLPFDMHGCNPLVWRTTAVMMVLDAAYQGQPDSHGIGSLSVTNSRNHSLVANGRSNYVTRRIP